MTKRLEKILGFLSYLPQKYCDWVDDAVEKQRVDLFFFRMLIFPVLICVALMIFLNYR